MHGAEPYIRRCGRVEARAVFERESFALRIRVKLSALVSS